MDTAKVVNDWGEKGRKRGRKRACMAHYLVRTVLRLSPLLRDKWEMNPAIVMFHLLQSHPKKYKASLQLLQLAELLNPLLHHSDWMCARQHLAAFQVAFCLSVCLSFFLHSTQMQMFPTVFLTTFMHFIA